MAFALAVLRHTGSPAPLLDYLDAYEAANGTPHVLRRYFDSLRGDRDTYAAALPGIDPALMAAAMNTLDHATLLRHLDRVILEQRDELLRPHGGESIEDLLSNEK